MHSTYNIIILLYVLLLLPYNVVPEETSKARRTAAFALLLPGKVLHLSALIVSRKFRDKGNKPGAIAAFKLLESSSLGKLHETKSVRGTDKVIIFSSCVQNVWSS